MNFLKKIFFYTVQDATFEKVKDFGLGPICRNTGSSGNPQPGNRDRSE